MALTRKQIHKILDGHGTPTEKVTVVNRSHWYSMIAIPSQYVDSFKEWLAEESKYQTVTTPTGYTYSVAPCSISLESGDSMIRRYIMDMFHLGLDTTCWRPYDGGARTSNFRLVDMPEDDPEWQKLYGTNPLLVEKMCRIYADSHHLRSDHHYITNQPCSQEASTKAYTNKFIDNCSRILVACSSMTDVITNSSSELFVCADASATASALKDTIRQYHDISDTDRYSGDGGTIDVYPFNIKHRILDTFADIYTEDGDIEEIEVAWYNNRDMYPISEFSDADIEAMESLYKELHRFGVDDNLYMVRIDQGFDDTIGFIKTALDGVRID